MSQISRPNSFADVFFARKAFDANIANFVCLQKKKATRNDSNLPE